MMKRFTAVVMSAVLTLPGVAFASEGADGDWIHSHRPTLDVCDGAGTTISFEVHAGYSEATQHVVVEVDGEVVYGPSSDEPETINVDGLLTGDGEHTIIATIYDNSGLDEVAAQHEYNFDIDCHRGGLAVLDDENRHIYQSDSPDEGEADCCPGNGGGSSDDEDSDDGDEDSEEVAKKPMVKGATASKTSNLKQLNSVFRSVYGRNPTYSEWAYWAKRLTNDKPQLDALYGAMQWHKLRGRTIGA